MRKIMSGVVVVAAVGVVLGLAAAKEIEIGKKGPDFKAKGVDGKEYTLESFKEAKVVVVTFTCNNCPVAVAYEDRLIAFAKKYKKKDVAVIAINANNASENLEDMKKRAKEKGFTFTYAFDETGESAAKYGASVTPHLFVLDKDRKVAYRGSFDDKQEKPSKTYLADAVDALLADKKPELTSTKAFGCGIKAKKVTN